MGIQKVVREIKIILKMKNVVKNIRFIFPFIFFV